MIITQTPFRVSFFGGGTDYPEHFRSHGGAVLGTAIDQSAYLQVCPFHSKLFDYSIRIAYSKVEECTSIDDIEHAPFRECMKWCEVTSDVEINYSAEMPSYTGLGSSSTFIVGLLNALHAYAGRAVSGQDLAYQAIELEREILGDAVGCQDQAFAALGGFNLIEFRDVDDMVVHRVPMTAARREEINAHLLLVYTGLRRRASDLAKAQIAKVADNANRLLRMRKMVDEGYEMIAGDTDFVQFGALLHHAWREKRKIDDGIANEQIDALYQRALDAGATGGKLLGAGGGGFMLFVVPPEKRQSVKEACNGLEELDIRVNAPGTRIIHAT